MTDEAKKKIILDSGWVYLKGTGYSICKDRALMQQNAHYKAYKAHHQKSKKDTIKNNGFDGPNESNGLEENITPKEKIGTRDL